MQTTLTKMEGIIQNANNNVLGIIENIKLKTDIQDIIIHHYTGDIIPSQLLQSIICRLSKSLRSMYESSTMEWNADDKLKQISSCSQHTLTLSTTNCLNFAFVSFQFEIEDEDNPQVVLYVYELYVDERWRGKRIACTLMNCIQDIAIECHMSNIMLTVFDKNIPALNMYKNHLSYVNDPSCPTKWDIYDTGYQILSKVI